MTKYIKELEFVGDLASSVTLVFMCLVSLANYPIKHVIDASV